MAVAQGIETLLEDMVKADVEWSKLAQVPGLVDGWTDFKDKLGVATEEFKAGDFSLPSTFVEALICAKTAAFHSTVCSLPTGSGCPSMRNA